MLLKNGKILIGEDLLARDILVDSEGTIVEIGENLSSNGIVYDLKGGWVIPSAVDVHVHLREPGYEYKETVKSGTLASSKGGVGTNECRFQRRDASRSRGTSSW